MENITVVGIDLARYIFQIHAINGYGAVVIKRALKWAFFLKFFANLPPCLIGMEACASAHFWGRQLAKQGHTVKLMAPQYVKPYVKSNQNDVNDAEGIW